MPRVCAACAVIRDPAKTAGAAVPRAGARLTAVRQTRVTGEWPSYRSGEPFELEISWETDDPALFDVWLDNWRDLGTFEVYPVLDSASAAAHVHVDWDG